MSDPDLRRQLEERLAALRDRVSRIQTHLRRPGHRDSGEQATEAENDQVLEGLDEAERGEIAELERALARLDAGHYGRCGRCGEEIGEARLRALPTAATCIACAS